MNVSLLAHYVQALEVRKIADEMAAVFAGRVPHSTALVPGGVTQVPTLERIVSYRARLKKVMEFAESVYVPDLLEVAKVFPQYFEIGRGRDNFLSYGVFPHGRQRQQVHQGRRRHRRQMGAAGPGATSWKRWATPASRNRRGGIPRDGQTNPEAEKANAYSWIKAPRYRGQPMEVGPLARIDGQLSRSVGNVDQEGNRRIPGQREGSGREVEFGARTPCRTRTGGALGRQAGRQVARRTGGRRPAHLQLHASRRRPRATA